MRAAVQDHPSPGQQLHRAPGHRVGGPVERLLSHDLHREEARRADHPLPIDRPLDDAGPLTPTDLFGGGHSTSAFLRRVHNLMRRLHGDAAGLLDHHVHTPLQAGDPCGVMVRMGQTDIGRVEPALLEHIGRAGENRGPLPCGLLCAVGERLGPLRIGVADGLDVEPIVAGFDELLVPVQMGPGDAAAADDRELDSVGHSVKASLAERHVRSPSVEGMAREQGGVGAWERGAAHFPYYCLSSLSFPPFPLAPTPPCRITIPSKTPQHTPSPSKAPPSAVPASR